MQGVSAEQDAKYLVPFVRLLADFARAPNAERKLLRNLKFPEYFSTKVVNIMFGGKNLTNGQVDMNKVNLDVIKPWITRAVIDLLGFEDDVVIDYAFSQLEDSPNVDPAQASAKLLQQTLMSF